MESMEIEDTGPNGLHGRLVNLPTRAMKGAAWTGAERDWKRAPHHYARDPFPRRRPARLRLGRQLQLHGAEGPEERRLRHAARPAAPHRDIIPFFVRPELGKPTAKVVYLASTFTYQVYTNFARGLFNDAFRQRVADWKASPNNPDDHKDYGLSTYNHHRDGSGVAYSSRLRPLLTWRPNFLALFDTTRLGPAPPAGRFASHRPGSTAWASTSTSSPTTTSTARAWRCSSPTRSC